MRNKEATPCIIRANGIQHESVFVAAIRPNVAGKKLRKETLDQTEATKQVKLAEE